MAGIPATTVANLSVAVQNRLEETAGSPIFWSLNEEIYSGIVEAMNEAMLIVGRPTLSYSVPVTLSLSAPVPCGTLTRDSFGNVSVSGSFTRVATGQTIIVANSSDSTFNGVFQLVLATATYLQWFQAGQSASTATSASYTSPSPWQTMPKGMLAITNITCNGTQLRRTTLRGMDYTLADHLSGWTQDSSVAPRSWFPVGLTMFGVYPAPIAPVVCTVSGISFPWNSSWPPTGNETCPYEDQYFDLIEQYAAGYARLKEGGSDFFVGGMGLYQSFLNGMKEMTRAQSRRDPLIFSGSFGAPGGVSGTKRT